ncbi:hypothetical protein [Lewinella cohaerens]|uniref:hypothetical protein n=1 Tax=Lewinella cohaerens TaxID=70995 RepID=UPI000381C8F5|nr:hypothetical protein [Lewinella cohaerens]
MIKKITFLFAFSCFLLTLMAQSADVLHLRSGKTVQGTILNYTEDNKIVFKRAEDDIVQTYPLEAVEQIQQLPTSVEEGWRTALPIAQEKKVISNITLNDGTVHKGIIKSYSPEGEMKVQLKTTRYIVFIMDTEVREITYEMPSAKHVSEYLSEEPNIDKPSFERRKPVYEFQEEGWFNTTSFAFSFGKRERDNDVIFFDPNFQEATVTQSAIGFNIQHIMGYQFNRLVGAGLGVSYDAYDLEDGESILSVFGHYRGYLSRSIVAPYLGLSAGYGFALTNKNQGVVTAEGGWMIHPEVGLRLGATEKTNFTISLGYRLQDAYYVQERPFNGNIEYRNITYQRFLFSLGLLF